jgi:hypothetical protein
MASAMPRAATGLPPPAFHARSERSSSLPAVRSHPSAAGSPYADGGLCRRGALQSKCSRIRSASAARMEVRTVAVPEKHDSTIGRKLTRPSVPRAAEPAYALQRLPGDEFWTSHTPIAR